MSSDKSIELKARRKERKEQETKKRDSEARTEEDNIRAKDRKTASRHVPPDDDVRCYPKIKLRFTGVRK